MTNIVDQMNSTTVAKAQRVAFKLLDRIQEEQPGDQVVGSAMFFLAMCDRFGTDPRDVLSKASRVWYDSFSVGKGEQARAIREYLKEEL